MRVSTRTETIAWNRRWILRSPSAILRRSARRNFSRCTGLLWEDDCCYCYLARKRVTNSRKMVFYFSVFTIIFVLIFIICFSRLSTVKRFIWRKISTLNSQKLKQKQQSDVKNWSFENSRIRGRIVRQHRFLPDWEIYSSTVSSEFSLILRWLLVIFGNGREGPHGCRERRKNRTRRRGRTNRETRHSRNRKRKHKAKMINAAGILNGAAIPHARGSRGRVKGNGEERRGERVRMQSAARECTHTRVSARLSQALLRVSRR